MVLSYHLNIIKMSQLTPQEALDAAKLATIISGHLRTVDRQTDGSNPANRINTKKFADDVVRVSKGLQPRSGYDGYQNSDEAAVLEILNQTAASSIPDIVQQKPNLIPMPQQPENNNAQSYIPPQLTNQTSTESETYIELIQSIDNSLKLLCEHFIDNGGTVKKKKKKTLSIASVPKVGAKLPTISKEEEKNLLNEIEKAEIALLNQLEDEPPLKKI